MTPNRTDQAEIRRYYGEVLRSSRDLKTGACCSTDSLSAPLRALLEDIHPEVQQRFYGCGTPLPPALDDCTVLDLGCGSGRDGYLLSRLVGPNGRVIGIDMTPEQLAIARAHIDWHTQRFGYERPNIEFREGFIEDLASAGIADASIDVVVSNCVLNLSPAKPQVFAEIFRVLKPGGEVYFSDVFADRRLPVALRQDPVLLGECLAGAMYYEDFRRLAQDLGCKDVRTIGAAPIALFDPAIEAKIGFAQFRSLTLRAFKLDLEDRCEDYGQIACYRGSMAGLPHAFELDDHHRFETGKPLRVCGNTYDMLAASRFAPHFELLGDRARHFGLFDCTPSSSAARATAGAACC